MIRLLGMFISIVFTSCYFFPFEFVVLPGINTKMVMAGISLLILAFQLGMKMNPVISKDFFSLTILALLVSLVSFTSMVYNDTQDRSYATYCISMWVWLGGAYTLIQWLKWIHGYISIQLVGNYLIAVCVMQCFLAYFININPSLKQFVDGFLGGEAFMGRAEGRLYGIGCALDVAGLRFSAVLVIITYFILNSSKEKRGYIPFYLFAFMVVIVIGNMIARSTVVGMGIAIAYLILFGGILQSDNQPNRSFFWHCIGISLLVAVPFVAYLYHVNHNFYENLRFGFEGFFSLWEKGYWEVTSNNILTKHMIVFPETLKTWVIGDGYAANPLGDPYYIGEVYGGFYKGTDIGYLRFLFYFGVIGTLSFILFVYWTAWTCMKRFPKYQTMFILILIVNLVGWLKVSTDIFIVFAPFLCISKEENDAYEQRIALKQ